MDTDDLNTVKQFNKILSESKEILGSITALEMLNKTSVFQGELRKQLKELKLPVSVLVGMLMCEMIDVIDDVTQLDNIAQFEAFKRYVDEKFSEFKHYVDTKDSLLKKYIEDNFIKREAWES